jgi:poly(A) polymerase
VSGSEARFRRLAEQLAELVERFSDAGHRLYLVGGAVRDGLLDHDVGVDYDLTTDAPPERTLELLTPWVDVVWTQGARFGTIGGARHGLQYEITTHREEAYDPDSRKPLVRFASEVEADLSRRDFTVNAMALTLPGAELVDPFGGREDLLERHLLRTPLAPELSFEDDPLRLLRAARFVARFDLTPAPDLVAAARALAGRIAIVSAERIDDELGRLLATRDPRPGLALLAEVGLLDLVLPEALDGDWDPLGVAPRPGSDGTADDRLALLLAGAGPERAAARMAALRASNDRRRDVRLLVEGIGTVEAEPPSTDAELRGLAVRYGSSLERLVRLVAARDGERGEALAGALDRLRAREDLDDLGPVLDGSDVIGLLGIEPGPVVGEALAHLRRHRLDSGSADRDEATAELRRWWAARSAEEGDT